MAFLNDLEEFEGMINQLIEENKQLIEENKKWKRLLKYYKAVVKNTPKDELSQMVSELIEENEELRCQLKNASKDEILLEDVSKKISENWSQISTDTHRGFKKLIKSGYKTLGDCRVLSMYDIINMPGVGPEASTIVIVALAHFHIIKVEDFSTSKVKKKNLSRHYFDFLFNYFRANIEF